MPAELSDEVPLPTETGDYPDGEGKRPRTPLLVSPGVFISFTTYSRIASIFPEYINFKSFLPVMWGDFLNA